MSSPFEKRSAGMIIFSTGFVVLWLVIAVFPFIWTVWGSFKVEGDFFSKADWRYAIYGVRTIARIAIKQRNCLKQKELITKKRKLDMDIH